MNPSYPTIIGSTVMKTFLLTLATALTLGLWAATAAAQQAPEKTAPPAMTPPDVQDIILFGETRPYLLRLHVRIDGKPFRTFQDDYFRKLFAYFDKDGDGVLTKEEAAQVPNPQFLQQKMLATI